MPDNNNWFITNYQFFLCELTEFKVGTIRFLYEKETN